MYKTRKATKRLGNNSHVQPKIYNMYITHRTGRKKKQLWFERQRKGNCEMLHLADCYFVKDPQGRDCAQGQFSNTFTLLSGSPLLNST